MVSLLEEFALETLTSSLTMLIYLILARFLLARKEFVSLVCFSSGG